MTRQLVFKVFTTQKFTIDIGEVSFVQQCEKSLNEGKQNFQVRPFASGTPFQGQHSSVEKSAGVLGKFLKMQSISAFDDHGRRYSAAVEDLPCDHEIKDSNPARFWPYFYFYSFLLKLSVTINH